jgi:hypothetical protein
VTYLAVSERPCRFAENTTLAFDQSGARVVEKCDLIRPDRPLPPIFTSRKLGSDADMPPRDGIAGVSLYSDEAGRAAALAVGIVE